MSAEFNLLYYFHDRLITDRAGSILGLHCSRQRQRLQRFAQRACLVVCVNVVQFWVPKVTAVVYL